MQSASPLKASPSRSALSRDRPRVALVLPGGGARAAFQAGVLSRLGEAGLLGRARILTGVSAGAINAAFLANHRDGLDRAAVELAELWANLETPRVLSTSPVSLAGNVARWGGQLLSGGSFPLPSPRALLDTAPLASLLRTYLGDGENSLSGLTHNLSHGALDALAITTTNYRTARAVTFAQKRADAAEFGWHRPYGEGRATELSVAHVMASAALPVLFPAIKLGSAWHGDGSLRQTAPLSPALHLGADRIIVVATSALPRQAEHPGPDMPYPSPAQVVGVVLNAMLFDHISYDVQNLNRITSLLGSSATDNPHQLRPVECVVVRPSGDLGSMAAEYEADLPRSLRYLTRGWGSKAGQGSDLLATVTFNSEYTARLVELGRQDAEARLEELSALLR